MKLRPRAPQPEDFKPAALLWHDAWHETQAPFVPNALIAQRGLSSFETRLSRMGDHLRVAGPVGAPVGICAIQPDILDQLFVAPAGRGTGVAAALLADAEARLLAHGSKTAMLGCLIENEQARRFYRRNGWIETRQELYQLDTSAGPFDLLCQVFEKELS